LPKRVIDIFTCGEQKYFQTMWSYFHLSMFVVREVESSNRRDRLNFTQRCKLFATVSTPT